MLMASFIAMAPAGWNWAKATEYRRRKARLDSRERELAADLARADRESRSPRLFPFIRARNQNTCQLILDQCAALADYIVNGRSSAWPPSDDDLRMIAAIITSSMENPENTMERTGSHLAAIADPVVYDYLSRVIVRGERLDKVFPAGKRSLPGSAGHRRDVATGLHTHAVLARPEIASPIL